MNKLLPKTLIQRRGFTLIELLVVISIIAILSVVAISTYSGIQSQARDAKRKSEISSLAKSIETAKDPTTNLYTYLAAQYSNDYTQSLPKDSNTNRTAVYCYATSTGTTPGRPGAPTTWATTSVCPTAPGAVAQTSTAYASIVDQNGAFQAGTNITAVKYWTVCALLESGTAPNAFCVSSINP